MNKNVTKSHKGGLHPNYEHVPLFDFMNYSISIVF